MSEVPTACHATRCSARTIKSESFCNAHRHYSQSAHHRPRRLYNLTFQDSRSAAYGFFSMIHNWKTFFGRSISLDLKMRIFAY